LPSSGCYGRLPPPQSLSVAWSVMTRFSTIMFDLSEVLIRGLVGIEGELSHLLGQPEETILPKLGGNRLRTLFGGSLTAGEYLRQIIESEKWDVHRDDIKALIRQNFHHEVDGMISLVESLSQRYPLVLVSDHAREWIDYIEHVHGFMSLFRNKVYSFQTGRTKDEPDCFPALLSSLGLSGGDCVFTDDNPRNVEQARRTGIHAVPYHDRASLVHELGSIGIEP